MNDSAIWSLPRPLREHSRQTQWEKEESYGYRITMERSEFYSESMNIDASPMVVYDMRSDSDIHMPCAMNVRCLGERPLGWSGTGMLDNIAENSRHHILFSEDAGSDPDVVARIALTPRDELARGRGFPIYEIGISVVTGESGLVPVIVQDLSKSLEGQGVTLLDMDIGGVRSAYLYKQLLHGLASSLFESWTGPTSIGVVQEELVEESLAGTSADDLSSALEDLDQVVEDASEDGFPSPSADALNSARHLLMDIYEIHPRRYEVYPTPDAEVAIDAPDGQGSSVLMLCDSGGGVLCLVNLKGESHSRSYPSVSMLPDEFLVNSLLSLMV